MANITQFAHNDKVSAVITGGCSACVAAGHHREQVADHRARLGQPVLAVRQGEWHLVD